MLPSPGYCVLPTPPYNARMKDPGTDPLSPLAHQILSAAAYDRPVVRDGAPAEAHRLLDGVTPEQLLTVPVASPPYAAALLGGLWLRHDALDECHHIVQKEPEDLMPRSTGSRLAQFTDAPKVNWTDARDTLSSWHAITHRREGDFSNSKYWYHRAAGHPILPAVGQYVSSAINHLPADKSLLRLLRGGWDPDALVDLAQELDRNPDPSRLQTFAAIQNIEWRLLFEHCARNAVGQ